MFQKNSQKMRERTSTQEKKLKKFEHQSNEEIWRWCRLVFSAPHTTTILRSTKLSFTSHIHIFHSLCCFYDFIKLPLLFLSLLLCSTINFPLILWHIHLFGYGSSYLNTSHVRFFINYVDILRDSWAQHSLFYKLHFWFMYVYRSKYYLFLVHFTPVYMLWRFLAVLEHRILILSHFFVFSADSFSSFCFVFFFLWFLFIYGSSPLFLHFS